MPDASLRIVTATPDRFPAVIELARRIWPACFAGMISAAQCEYMLGQRYRVEAMARAVAEGMIYELIHLDGAAVGFGAHGPAEEPETWKLWQIYVLPDLQGRGLGGAYIDHVVRVARAASMRTLVLTVNKGNDRARAVYERRGFRVRESARFDIGEGYVMDDFVMILPLDNG